MNQPTDPNLPLPPGWEQLRDGFGRVYYVDHNNQRSQWEHPNSIQRAQQQQNVINSQPYRCDQFCGVFGRTKTGICFCFMFFSIITFLLILNQTAAKLGVLKGTAEIVDLKRDTMVWIDHPENITFADVKTTYSNESIFPDEIFDGSWRLVQTTRNLSNPLYLKVSLGWSGDFRMWPIDSKIPSSWSKDKHTYYYYATATGVYLKDMKDDGPASLILVYKPGFSLAIQGIICYCLTIGFFLLVLYLGKKKLYNTPADIELYALLQIFIVTQIFMVPYLLGGALPIWGVALFAMLVCAISAIFVYFGKKDNLREKVMKSFFMWPMDKYTITAENYNLDRVTPPEKILWGTRILIMSFVLGGIAKDFILVSLSVHDDYGSAAVMAFFSAGFCEETYKMLFTGSISMFKQYRQSAQAIIQGAIAASLGFTTLEDLKYVVQIGAPALLRFAGVVNHTVFAIWVGYFLARQRDETIWGIEMGCGWLLAVFLHGLFDYFAMSGQVAPLIALFVLYNIIGCYAVCCYNIQDFQPLLEIKPEPRSRPAESEEPAIEVLDNYDNYSAQNNDNVSHPAVEENLSSGLLDADALGDGGI